MASDTYQKYRFFQIVDHTTDGKNKYNQLIINTTNHSMVFIIHDQKKPKTVQLKTEYSLLELETLEFVTTLLESTVVSSNGIKDKPTQISDNSNPNETPIFLKNTDWNGTLSLLNTRFSNVDLPYLKDRHIKSIFPLFRNTTCNIDLAFFDSMINLVTNRLLFYRWYQKSYIVEFLINSILISDTNTIKDLCVNKSTYLYPFIDKKLKVETAGDELKFLNRATSEWVKLPSTDFNTIFDTGNSSFTLIGQNIVKYLNIPVEFCKNLNIARIGGHHVCKKYVNIEFKIPNYGDNKYSITCFIDETNPDQLLFGWKSGLDQLFENRFVYFKQNNLKLIDKKNAILTYKDYDVNDQSRIPIYLDQLNTFIIKHVDLFDDTDLERLTDLYDDLNEINHVIDRNNRNGTFDMY